MKHPKKWRDTEDPFSLPFHEFSLTEVIGYPHAGNDVFQVKGTYRQREVETFIKVARQPGADIEREIHTMHQLDCPLAPQVIDHDDAKNRFVVTLARPGERLSTIVGENADRASLKYMYEYGQTLARLHSSIGHFPPVKDRRFFHIPERQQFETLNLQFVYEYLIANRPKEVNRCFCHGDFHYANILWENSHISAILDFELSGIGNKEFDIAWALILRPGQRFLCTEKEHTMFREGYSSLGAANWDYVKYYMVLIYFYFYRSCGDVPQYRKHIMDVFLGECTPNPR